MKIQPIILLLFVLICYNPLKGIHRDSLIRESIQNTNDTLKCRSLIKLAVYYADVNHDSAIYFSKQLLESATKYKISKYIITAHNFLGYNHREQGNYNLALEHLLTALDIGQKEKLKDREMFTRLDLGNLYTSLSQKTKSMDCLQKGLEIAKELNDTLEMVNFYNNMSLNFSDSTNADSAYHFLSLALNLLVHNPEFQQDQNYFDLQNNLAYSCSILKKNEEGLLHSLSVLKYGQDNKLSSYTYFGAINAAHFYLAANDLANTEKYLKLAEDNVFELNDLKQISILKSQKIDLLLKQGKIDEAQQEIKDYVFIRDSLSQNKYHKDIAELETKYNLKDKENQIAIQKSKLVKQRLFFITLLLSCILIIGGIIYYTKLQKAKQKQKYDAAIIYEQKMGLNAVLQAQEEERRRIAREIHDGISQELLAVSLSYAALSEELNDKAKEKLLKTNQDLNKSCTELRNISHVMLPPALENNNLSDALLTLLIQSTKNNNIIADCPLMQIPDSINKDKALMIYRIFQELIQNIIKHSKATKVSMQAYQLNNKVIFQLEDNGVGYNFEESISKGSLGLLNIISRAKNINAEFHSEASSPSGALSTLKVFI